MYPSVSIIFICSPFYIVYSQGYTCCAYFIPSLLFLQDGGIDAEEMEDTMDQSPSRQVDYIEGDQEAYRPRLCFKKPLPEQDIDKKNPKSDKTIAQELHDVEEKVHKFTGRLFDNHTYMITDTSVAPWGRRHQRKDEGGYDVKRDLDKLLGLGQFSQWNPLVSKFALMIDPLVRVSKHSCQCVPGWLQRSHMARSILDVFGYLMDAC